LWQKLVKRLKYQMDRKFLDKAWNTDVAIKVNSEVKELQKKLHDLQRRLCETCDSDAEARHRCHQLVSSRKLTLITSEKFRR